MKPAPPVTRKVNSERGAEWKDVSYKGCRLPFAKKKENSGLLSVPQIFEWKAVAG